MEYDKLGVGCEERVIDVQSAREILQDLLQKCEDLLNSENLQGGEEVVALNSSDSKDWMKIAPKYNLYKLCKLMLDNEVEDFVAWTEMALEKVIAFSMSRLPDMIVKQCWKWAHEFEEDKIWEAVHLAGNCRGIMEAWTNQGVDN
ncbi:hypothetical protein SUGI_0689430 [Cryptomeria japonica]|nr:hypothetical protein SUGI_0689430 [Cryptomeria japonica]